MIKPNTGYSGLNQNLSIYSVLHTTQTSTGTSCCKTTDSGNRTVYNMYHL